MLSELAHDETRLTAGDVAQHGLSIEYGFNATGAQRRMAISARWEGYLRGFTISDRAWRKPEHDLCYILAETPFESGDARAADFFNDAAIVRVYDRSLVVDLPDSGRLRFLQLNLPVFETIYCANMAQEERID